MKDFIIGAVAVVALLIGGFALFDKPLPPAGSVVGPDVTFFQHFYSNINVGGYDFATTSQGAATYTAVSIANSRVIEHIAPATLTATLPTSAALSAVGFLPNIGDTQTLYIHASTTKITLAGGVGTPLFTSASTTVVNAGSTARLDFVRLGATEGRQIQVLLHND